MTTNELKELFSGAEDNEFMKFERVENKRSWRPDLHAFLLLDELYPCAPGKNEDLICNASHDEICLVPNCEELAKVITPDQVIELSRCGVRYDRMYDSLAMFV